ncbi:MAG TPA: CopG family ribbon-helix-helix protein [Candidatus Nitrosotalea sp.]|nr:CopG family ribbon-helix-helix protein [Candidatus Nitrosotalea sp.]
MGIISISLNDNILKEMDILQKEFGFTGRSELIRAGIRMLLSDKIEKEKQTGDIGSILTVTHEEEDEEAVIKIKHKYENIIQTHLHCKIRNNKCLELFVLNGKATKITQMSREFQASDEMEHVKLTTT